MRFVTRVSASNLMTDLECHQLNTAFYNYAVSFMDQTNPRFQLFDGRNYLRLSQDLSQLIDNAGEGVLPGTFFLTVGSANYYKNITFSAGDTAKTPNADQAYKHNIISVESGVEFTRLGLSGMRLRLPTVNPVLRTNIMGEGRESIEGLPMLANHLSGTIPVRYNFVKPVDLNLELAVRR